MMLRKELGAKKEDLGWVSLLSMFDQLSKIGMRVIKIGKYD